MTTEPARWTLRSPESGGRTSALEARIELLVDGALAMSVHHGPTVVLESSGLGIVAAHGDFSHGLSFVGSATERVDETYSTVVGKRREHRLLADQLSLDFAKGADRITLQVRVTADGVAFRYVLPWSGPVTVITEPTRYVVPETARSILLPYDNGRCDYETIHEHAAVATATCDIYGYPALFQVDDTWLLVTESDVDGRYAGSRLVLDEVDGVRGLRLSLPDPYTTGPSPLATPWRTLIVGDLATVVGSDLVTGLAAPARFEDTSWIEPGIAAWSWWSDGQSPRDPEVQRAFVDYAGSLGWRHVLVDAGWGADWVPDLVAYAAERNVAIWLWERWQNLDTDSEHRDRLDRWRDWGVVGVKIDFTESDGQDRMRWFDSVLAATAERRLMVNFHGGTIPRGTERTWPHYMTAEAVRGAENIKPNRNKNPFPPRHYTTLAFTRNVQGSMDFTPVTFSAERLISAAHELALAVIYESGVQHFADSLESYRALPAAERLLARVPAVWDHTRLLTGDPTDHVVLARRNGVEWFIGGGYATDEPRTVRVPLGFLAGENSSGLGTWIADIWRDDPTNPHDALLTETERVDLGPDAELEIEVAPNGGFTVHLRPAVQP